MKDRDKRFREIEIFKVKSLFFSFKKSNGKPNEFVGDEDINAVFTIIWGIGKGSASVGLHHRHGDLAPGLLQISFRNEGQRTLHEYSHGRQSSQVVWGQQNLFVVWVPVLLQTQPLQGTLGCHVCTSEDGTEAKPLSQHVER